MIVSSGSVNTTALVVPGLTVQIVPPGVANLNGVPTNVVGMVGTATYGPVNTPVIVSNYASYKLAFGDLVARTYDMGTHVATAINQGASNFRCVRVTDGTDTAATYTITTGIEFTALYTGSFGDNIQVNLSTGSKAATTRCVISIPGVKNEVFDNIAGTAGTFWTNLENAINNGTSQRGKSKIVVASTPGTTAIPTLPVTYTLTGGTDGVSTINSTVLVGSDSSPRTGMYALRSSGCSVVDLCDGADATAWAAQGAYGLSEGSYMIAVGPSGDTISNAVTTKQTAGIDQYPVKMMFGDYLYWPDPITGQTRLVSPQGAVAGLLGNLTPNQSTLNKELYGFVGSQKVGLPGTGQAACYSQAELQTLIQAGWDVISNPAPGGSYWAVLSGTNSSSDATVNGDNYTRMINYIASTINAGMGIYIGGNITTTTFNAVTATLNAFFNNLVGQGILAKQTNGALPYSVVCNASNNPFSRTSLGYLQADVQVQFEAVTRFLTINVQGGQTVSIVINNSVQ